MNFIKNLKIGGRLGLGFGLVFVLLLAIAYVAITRISSINVAMDDVLKDRYAKVSMATTMRAEAAVQALFLRNAIISAKAPAELKSSLLKVEEAVK